MEDAVATHYRTVRLQPDFIKWVHDAIDDVLRDQVGAQQLLHDQLSNRLSQLSVTADNLIDLVADGGLASSKATQRIREIENEKRVVEAELTNVNDDLNEGATHIRG